MLASPRAVRPCGPMTSIGPYNKGVEESRPRRGQYGKREKSVKKNAALLHFLGFFPLTLLFGVPRGRAPLGGVAGSRSDQSPSGALNRTSGPALLDGGHRFGRQARCLATAGLFSLPFLVTKKVGLMEESHNKRPCRKVGRAGQARSK